MPPESWAGLSFRRRAEPDADQRRFGPPRSLRPWSRPKAPAAGLRWRLRSPTASASAIERRLLSRPVPACAVPLPAWVLPVLPGAGAPWIYRNRTGRQGPRFRRAGATGRTALAPGDRHSPPRQRIRRRRSRHVGDRRCAPQIPASPATCGPRSPPPRSSRPPASIGGCPSGTLACRLPSRRSAKPRRRRSTGG